MLKTLLVLEIFTFFFMIFGYVGKRLDNKAEVSDWTSNLYNAHIVQYLKK